jgi:hypothetical protein
MNRWIMRMLGVLLLLVFMLVFVNLYNQLVQLQNRRNTPAATST